MKKILFVISLVLQLQSSSLLGASSLHVAAEKGSLKRVKVLLEQHHFPDTKDEHGRTPLYRATERRHADVVLVLLAAGADSNIIASESGQSPLHLAAKGGMPNLVKAFVRAGGRVNVRACGSYGNKGYVFGIGWVGDRYTPLELAAYNNDVKSLNVLLGAGADPMLGGEEHSQSALHYAAESGALATIKILLKNKKVEVDAVDALGRTPLLTYICSFAYIRFPENAKGILTAFLDSGANPNFADSIYGHTILYYTMYEGNRDAVETLLKHGACPKLKCGTSTENALQACIGVIEQLEKFGQSYSKMLTRYMKIKKLLENHRECLLCV